jgi:hypothetical protein
LTTDNREFAQYNRRYIKENAMNRLWIVALACLLAPAASAARANCDKVACNDVKEEIREIESRMRSGYSRAQGERYEAKLRKLKRKRKQLCR